MKRITQLLRYGLVGSAAASSQLLVTFLGYQFTAFAGASAATGYLAGLIVSFIGQRSFTFKSQNAIHRDMRHFVILAVGIFIMNYGLMWGLITLYVPAILASLACVSATTVISFMAMKFWIFRTSQNLDVKGG